MKKKVFQEVLDERLRRFNNKTAIEYGTRTMTFGELDKRSDYIANWILGKGMKKESMIGILLDDRAEFIAAIIGILKSGCIFVPLVSDYPGERLAAMIDEVDIKIIVTDKANIHRFKSHDQIVQQGFDVFLIEDLFLKQETRWFTKPPDIHFTREDKIYIYFTSGTTGKPKAILGKNKSLLHFIEWEIETFNITRQFRCSQFITPAFDAFLRDVFVPLFAGGVLCIPENQELILNSYTLIQWLDELGINLVHCVPSFFRLLNSKFLNNDSLKALRFILLSGEKINPAELVNWYDTIGDRVQLVNLYGPTETTMIKSYYLIRPPDVRKERIPIGKPMEGCRIVVCDENMKICDKLVPGEIYIRTPFRTFGYYNDPRSTNEKFIKNPFNDDADDLLYKTGDLGKLLPDGNIELLARIDRQVKIRGIRIELEEIESVLSRHPGVKEAVVIKMKLANTNEFLCAFINFTVENNRGDAELILSLKDYLSGKLPGYMVPATIMKIDDIPRKPNGKTDYEALAERYKNESADLAPPTDDIEATLLGIWREILERKTIGVNDSFFALGGSSLNMMALISKIHIRFDIRISMGDLFKNATIRELAGIIAASEGDRHQVRETVKLPPDYARPPLRNSNRVDNMVTRGIVIKAEEEKEYYPMSYQQKGLYFIQKFNPGTISYNMPMALVLKGDVQKIRLEEALVGIINMQNILRTSFEMINDNPVQRVHQDAPFEVEYYEMDEEEAKMVVMSFIKPFDLGLAPLLRIKLIRISHETHILLFDLHHIISDAISNGILIREFMKFYTNRKDELTYLYTQYSDYSQWYLRLSQSGELDRQEAYWLTRFSGEIPRLTMTTDFSRPEEKNLKGGNFFLKLDAGLTNMVKKILCESETTLYIFLLTVYTIFLSKYSGQDDIVVGSPISGRTHPYLYNTIGLFANMLPMRNSPKENLRFRDFFREVETNALNAYENQDYQFTKLVSKLKISKNLSRHPLFDAVLAVNNPESGDIENKDFHVEPYDYEFSDLKFDLLLDAWEEEDFINFNLNYSVSLFKRATAEKMLRHLVEILEQVCEDDTIMLKDIKFSHALVRVESVFHEEKANPFGF